MSGITFFNKKEYGMSVSYYTKSTLTLLRNRWSNWSRAGLRDSGWTKLLNRLPDE